MTIPRALVGSPANGTQFTSVTGYAFSERGALLPMAAGTGNPSSLPIKVDASGAASYVVGQGGPQLDGVVEVSLDDPNFSAPRTATIGDAINGNSWSLTLAGAELVPGAHTAYVRQRINGRDSSPAVSVAFHVASHARNPDQRAGQLDRFEFAFKFGSQFLRSEYQEHFFADDLLAIATGARQHHFRERHRDCGECRQRRDRRGRSLGLQRKTRRG
jgi:hypothetical protein